MGLLRTLLNLIWLVLAGVWAALGYAVAGAVCCVTIVAIPWGIACFRIAAFTLWPFGRVIVRRADAGVGSALGNLVWIVLAGWWLALIHIVTGVALCLTMIGLPLGVANFKLVPVSLVPLGRRIVDLDDGADARFFDVGRPVPAQPVHR